MAVIAIYVYTEQRFCHFDILLFKVRRFHVNKMFSRMRSLQSKRKWQMLIWQKLSKKYEWCMMLLIIIDRNLLFLHYLPIRAFEKNHKYLQCSGVKIVVVW